MARGAIRTPIPSAASTSRRPEPPTPRFTGEPEQQRLELGNRLSAFAQARVPDLVQRPALAAIHDVRQVQRHDRQRIRQRRIVPVALDRGVRIVHDRSGAISRPELGIRCAATFDHDRNPRISGPGTTSPGCSSRAGAQPPRGRRRRCISLVPARHCQPMAGPRSGAHAHAKRPRSTGCRRVSVP